MSMDLEYIVERTMRFLVFHSLLPFCVPGKSKMGSEEEVVLMFLLGVIWR